jgi:hypothetical protein
MHYHPHTTVIPDLIRDHCLAERPRAAIALVEEAVPAQGRDDVLNVAGAR